MKKIIFVIITMLFSYNTFASESIPGQLRTVINQDGTFSYYFIPGTPLANNAVDLGLDKSTLTKYFNGDNASSKVFEIYDQNKKLVTGYYLPSSKPDGLNPLNSIVDNGLTVKATSFNELPAKIDSLYKFTDSQGDLGGIWIPKDQYQGTAMVGNMIPDSWSTSKIAYASYSPRGSKAIPIPKDEFIASVREQMLQQAIDLACRSKIIPKEIAVTASLAASVGFIVGGEGSISFEATWETSKLCN